MKKMKLILNESLISNKDSDIIEDTTTVQKPDYQIIDITVIPDETYYPTIQSILIDLDENNKLKESENNKLDINILSETVNQKTGYSNSLFEFESSNHTITLSLVLQETDRRGIYKVEAYTTRGIKVFESNTYRPKYVIESYLNSLANEYLIDKPLKESVRIYDDEKDYSSELSEVYNIVADFINDRFYYDNDVFLEYSEPNNYHNRVDRTKVFNGIAQKLNGAGYGVNTDAKHHAGIGNNNAYELFNKNSECIGVLNVNSSLYSEVYVYLEKLNGESYGGTWELRPASSDNLQRKRVVIYKEGETLDKKNSKDKEAFHKFAEKMKRLGFLDIKDMTALSDNGFVDKLSFDDLNMFNKLENISYQDIQDMVRKELKEAEEVEDGSVYKLTISKDENSGPQTVWRFNTREAAEKEEEFFKFSGLYTRIDEEKITRSKEDIQKRIDEIENEIQKKVKRYSSAQKQYHGDNSLSDRLEGEVDSLEQEQKRLRALLGEAEEDILKDEVKEDLAIEPGSDEEQMLDEIYEEPEEDKYYGAEDTYEDAQSKGPSDYTPEEFIKALQLANEIYELNIDYSEWNNLGQEERFDLVTPEIGRFLSIHKNEFDKNPRLFDLLQYNLTDANFHTEAKVLRDLYRGGE